MEGEDILSCELGVGSWELELGVLPASACSHATEIPKSFSSPCRRSCRDAALLPFAPCNDCDLAGRKAGTDAGLAPRAVRGPA